MHAYIEASAEPIHNKSGTLPARYCSDRSDEKYLIGKLKIWARDCSRAFRAGMAVERDLKPAFPKHRLGGFQVCKIRCQRRPNLRPLRRGSQGACLSTGMAGRRLLQNFADFLEYAVSKRSPA